jgi:hypothetical protein
MPKKIMNSKPIFYGRVCGGVPAIFEESTGLRRKYCAVKSNKRWFWLYSDGRTDLISKPYWNDYDKKVAIKEWIPFDGGPFRIGI